MKTLLRLYKVYGKMDLLWFLRDTRYCLLYMVSDLVALICSMTGIFLLSARFGGFGGMNQEEILFMLGYATIVNGIYMMFFMGNNTGMISRIIGRGQLDHTMIQPAPLWMQLLAQGFSPVSGNTTLLFGIGISLYSLLHLEINITPLWILLLWINTLASCIIMIAIIYLLSCLAFYAPAAAEEIAQSGMDLCSINHYPLGGLSKKAQVVFCGFIPVGLTAWAPSTALLQLGYGTPLISLILTPAAAITMAVITILCFKKGMNYYATYGSPRYSGFGHR